MQKKRHERILIVDDNPMNISIIEEILGEEFEVNSASSGKEALCLADKFHPDLILLDIMMPDIDGYELCRSLRANKRLAFVKIILISAKSMLNDRLEGYRAGADDYITKPFDPEELLAKTRVFLRLKSVEEIERVKDDLINIFSHETRTPLNAIIGFAKVLEESPDLTAHHKEALQHIISSGEDLMALADKTILLSNLRKGVIAIKQNKTAFSLLVTTALAKVSSALEDKKIKVENKINNNAVLKVDEQLVITAIVYILDNAVKFSPENGALEINCFSNEKGIFLNIKDFGKGISEDKLGLLFSEFAVESVLHHGRGHGLGLSIVRYIMELHGGDVYAKNNSDGTTGTTFTLVFPPELITTQN